MAKKSISTAVIEIGTIFVYDWGFNQTNINFYQVIDKTNSMLVLQEIRSSYVGKGFLQGEVTPIKDDFIGKPFKKKLLDFGGTNDPKYALSFNYGSCSIWNNKPQFTSSYA